MLTQYITIYMMTRQVACTVMRARAGVQGSEYLEQELAMSNLFVQPISRRTAKNYDLQRIT